MNDRLDELERLVDLYCAGDRLEAACRAFNKAVEEHNAFVEQVNREIGESSAKLEARLPEIRELEARITQADRHIEKHPGDEASVRDRNALVERYNQLAEAFTSAQARHERRGEERSREVEERGAQVEKLRPEAEEATRYGKWMTADGAMKLSRAVNELYASVRERLREGHRDARELAAAESRLKAMRERIGERTRQRESQRENGMLIIPAELGDGERSYLVVDNGASLTSLTMEMVRVLDIGRHVGDEVELNLPNAITIKAPELSIPRMEIQGRTAEHVKAVVLKESTPGVDGCLGLSFMSRFDCSIRIGTSERRLLLEPLRVPPEAPRFDVFICHKSQDYSAARQIFDSLVAAGTHPFLSEESIPETGTTNYHRAIHLALETCRHMIVVCSSREKVRGPWVASEWELFDNLIQSGTKDGNIIPILCHGMVFRDLPLPLQRYHAIPLDEGGKWRQEVLRFLPGCGGR